MKNPKTIISALIIALFIFNACTTATDQASKVNEPQAKGSLFIIGGGSRSDSLMKQMVKTANLNQNDYIIVLPMSSEEPDTAFFYAKKSFEKIGYSDVKNFYFGKGSKLSAGRKDSLLKAKLIYISGGDQNRFMDIIKGTGVKELLNQCYMTGTTIAGTSAGAAMMSEKMITGNELKHNDYNETFRSIESDNIEIAEGLGLIKSAIIDQHFIKRSRYNRLISSAMEYPELLMIGIDESTAIIVQGDSAQVVGENQVIVIKNESSKTNMQKGLLGCENLRLSVYLPQERFAITK